VRGDSWFIRSAFSSDSPPDTNRTRLIRKAHPTDSFFNFFAPPVPPAEDALENGDVDEEELEDLEERLELDYQIGEDLKERVGP
jgi:nucleosome assembly protein 1-like 1